MTEVISYEMFPLEDAGPVMPRREDDLAGLSPGRKRTIRRLWKIAEGVHPITGLPLHPLAPADANRNDRIKDRPYCCGSCIHRFTDWGNGSKTYPKCDLKPTRSEWSDLPAWLPGCTAYVLKDGALKDV